MNDKTEQKVDDNCKSLIYINVRDAKERTAPML